MHDVSPDADARACGCSQDADRLIAGSGVPGADAADGEAAAAEALGRSTPLAPPAELAARTWADEELRQLALREVQREREEVLHT